MRGNKLRVVMIVDQVEGTERHCNNGCQHMFYPRAGSLDIARCDLFDAILVWDKRKREHGYERTAACKEAERVAKS